MIFALLPPPPCILNLLSLLYYCCCCLPINLHQLTSGWNGWHVAFGLVRRIAKLCAAWGSYDASESESSSFARGVSRVSTKTSTRSVACYSWMRCDTRGQVLMWRRHCGPCAGSEIGSDREVSFNENRAIGQGSSMTRSQWHDGLDWKSEEQKARRRVGTCRCHSASSQWWIGIDT